MKRKKNLAVRSSYSRLRPLTIQITHNRDTINSFFGRHHFSSCVCVNNNTNLGNPHFHESRLFSVFAQGRKYKRRETIVARWYSCTVHGLETMATRPGSRSIVVLLVSLFAVQVTGRGEKYEKLVGRSVWFCKLIFSFRERKVLKFLIVLCKIFDRKKDNYLFFILSTLKFKCKISSANDGCLFKLIFFFF